MEPVMTKNEQMNNGNDEEREWELRPGGMVVQKCIRIPAPPTIRVRVKYMSVYHEIRISSQATFVDLKKMLCGPTGLHHEDQILIYKGKERESKEFLDNVGVKDKSKLILQKDLISQQKRLLEMRRNAKMEKSARSISEISLTVDNLGAQVSTLESAISKADKVEDKDVTTLNVSTLESAISKADKVEENDVTTLTELLMNQLLKLDSIVVDGDVKLLRKMEVQRVQKYVETLDKLKMKIKKSMQGQHLSDKNIHVPVQPQIFQHGRASPSVLLQRHCNSSFSYPIQPERHSIGHLLFDSQRQENEPSRHANSDAAVVTTMEWETFDSTMPGPISTLQSSLLDAQSNVTWDFL